MLDVADYRHVHHGPGIILIGLEGNYSVENADGRLGVRYNRKAAVNGGNGNRLRQATIAALAALQRLETDASLRNKFRFNGQDIEIFVNDRLLAPSREETLADTKWDFETFFTELFRSSEYSLSQSSDSRRLFAVSAHAARTFCVAELLENLTG